MKIIFCIYLLLTFSSCSLIKNANKSKDDTVLMLCEVFEDDFFDNYKTKGKILLSDGENNNLSEKISRIKSIEDISNNDRLIQNSEKYVVIGEFFLSKDFMRMQIECIDKSKPYQLIYSTSYKRSENNTMELLDEISPFVDTLWIEK
jgi:hypothetical protein